MKRLFVAIDLPTGIKDELGEICSGIAGAKWVRREQMHLTLRFIGEVDDQRFETIKSGLSEVQAVPFTMRLEGVGQFPEKGKPRVLWVGVRAPNSLTQLQQQIENRLRKLGLEAADKGFTAHITLARFRTPPAPESMRSYFARHGDFGTEAIEVESFILYSSWLRPEGPTYQHEAIYPMHL